MERFNHMFSFRNFPCPCQERRQHLAPRKGLCSYFDIGGAQRAAWSYEDANPEVRRICGLVSFEPDVVPVHLDGARMRLEPGQSVIPHGVDPDRTLGEAAAGRRP
jgi:nucleotidyltransferase-like protein